MNRMAWQISSSLTAGLTALLIASSALAQNIAVVNGKPIPKAKANAIISQLVKQGQQATPQLEEAVREELINREILMQEADKKNLAANPEVQVQIERSRQQVLIGALAQEYFKNHPPTDAEARQQYDQLVKSTSGKEYRVRHILVEKEAEAKTVIAKLKAGAKFEDLAKQQSKDTGSAANGGDLDWANPSNYVKPFSDAIVKLEKGKITDMPVKTQFGYHVIRLDDVRDVKIPSFEEAKPRIIETMSQNTQWQQVEFRKMLDELRAKAKIE